MAWIELHQSIWSHRKTLILASELGIKETYAAAHMARLWTWALDNAVDGDLTGLPTRVIAYGAGWDGNPDEFVESAVKAGFLDREDDRLFIHDWGDYAGKLLESRTRKNSRASEMRKAYQNGTITRVRKRDGDRCRYCGIRVDWSDRKTPKGGTYDHIDPEGPSTVENLVVSCRGCNAKKGNRLPEEAGMELIPIDEIKRSFNESSNDDLIAFNNHQTTVPNLTIPNHINNHHHHDDGDGNLSSNESSNESSNDDLIAKDDRVSMIYDLAEKCFGRIPNPVEVEKILQFLDEGMETDVIVLAIRSAAERGKDLFYARRILESWVMKGIKTKFAAEADIAAWKGAKKRGINRRGSEESASELGRWLAENSL